LLPLICAAFKTTQPLRTFVELIGILRMEWTDDPGSPFFSQREPCRWPELFDNFLSRLPFDDETEVQHRTIQQEYFRLDLHDWVFSTAVHPTLTAIAQKWEALAASEDGLKWVLDLTGYVAPEYFGTCWQSFRPPATVYRFRFADGDNRVLFIRGGEKVLEVGGYDGGPGAIADLLTMWSTVRRATGAHYDVNERLCHHAKCPEFASNYCSLYPIVPDEFAKCGFRERVGDLRTRVMFLPKENRT